MTDALVTYEVIGKVALITIDRPARRNAIDQRTAEELQAAWRRLESGPERTAVITGAGDVFSAGADLKNPPTESWRSLPWVGVDLHKPVVAAVGGWCIGLGFAVAMMADLCVAADDAKFTFAEAKAGRIGGMIVGLVGRIPHKIAMEILLLGDPIDAARAYEAGLVNRIVPAGRQVEMALEMAAAVAERAPLVISYLKQETDRALVRGAPEHIRRDSRHESDRIMAIRTSWDAEEGRQAFRERRPPKFRGE